MVRCGWRVVDAGWFLNYMTINIYIFNSIVITISPNHSYFLAQPFVFFQHQNATHLMTICPGCGPNHLHFSTVVFGLTPLSIVMTIGLGCASCLLYFLAPIADLSTNRHLQDHYNAPNKRNRLATELGLVGDPQTLFV